MCGNGHIVKEDGERVREGGGLLSIYMLWNNNIQWFGITCIILVYNYLIGCKCFHRICVVN